MRTGTAAAAAPLSPQAFKRLSQLIYRSSRIHLGPGKQQLLASRLGRRLRELGLADFDAYCDLLQDGRNTSELGLVLDLISTNHTHFFRESTHFDLLVSRVLPELIAGDALTRQEFRCWSAASSSGEEAYTLAIILAEFARTQGPLEWRIQGSDISQRMLEAARLAIYDRQRLNLPRPEWLARYFQVGSGPYLGKCRVRDELRRRVRFEHLNLFDAGAALPQRQHVIFCRNALIYFDKASQEGLVARLHEQLVPGGVLIIGHSESLLNIAHPLHPLGNGLYQRTR